MQNGETAKLKMLYGIREGNKSFKIFKKNEKEFIVVKKHYILHLFPIKKILKFDNKEQAADYILQNTLKFHNIDI